MKLKKFENFLLINPMEPFVQGEYMLFEAPSEFILIYVIPESKGGNIDEDNDGVYASCSQRVYTKDPNDLVVNRSYIDMEYDYRKNVYLKSNNNDRSQKLQLLDRSLKLIWRGTDDNEAIEMIKVLKKLSKGISKFNL